jgi:hypothetical protein
MSDDPPAYMKCFPTSSPTANTDQGSSASSSANTDQGLSVSSANTDQGLFASTTAAPNGNATTTNTNAGVPPTNSPTGQAAATATTTTTLPTKAPSTGPPSQPPNGNATTNANATVPPTNGPTGQAEATATNTTTNTTTIPTKAPSAGKPSQPPSTTSAPTAAPIAASPAPKPPGQASNPGSSFGSVSFQLKNLATPAPIPPSPFPTAVPAPSPFPTAIPAPSLFPTAIPSSLLPPANPVPSSSTGEPYRGAMRLEITTDDYPQETSMKLTYIPPQGSATTTMSGVIHDITVGTLTQPSTTYRYSFQEGIVTVGTYVLEVMDSNNDGWCCKHGSGSVYVYQTNFQDASSSDYREELVYSFSGIFTDSHKEEFTLSTTFS